MAPCATLTLKKVSAAYTKMYEEQKHKMWLTPIAKITKYLQLAKLWTRSMIHLVS